MKNIAILLPIFSIPNNYGIGDFGPESYKFIDILAKNNIDYWQVLPLGPVDEANSPYSPISSFAFEPLYISIDLLIKDNLLKEGYQINITDKINYDIVRKIKYKYLYKAYQNFKGNDDYKEFVKDYTHEYEEFMALKKANKNALWKDFKNSKDTDEYNFQLFLQYIARKQYLDLKKYANKNGVKIMGDLPIYVNYDSADVYFNKENFMLENDEMKFVSGASPDYFSKDGQKWYHPLYNFDYQKEDNFNYLINKYKYVDKLYDVIRIDHFRAFDTFYKIPINKSGRHGKYVKGPGNLFFDKVFEVVEKDKFIVEDLGDLTDGVYKLRDDYNLCGMKIFEYTFDFKKKIDTMYETNNLIVYPGNHDNNTLVGWYNSLNKKQKASLDKFLEKYDGKIHEKVIYYLKSKPYKYLTFMIQDVLGQDENYRINIPGNNNMQWSYRLCSFDNIDMLLNKYFNNK